ncbi:MAG: copper resistance CopC family protein [Rhodospirillales bacterium]
MKNLPFHQIVAVLFLVPVMAATFASSVHAHAVVIETSMKEMPVRPGQATEVEIRFNSAVEAKLSRIFLIDIGGKELALKISAGSSPDRLVVELPALPAGAYIFRYRVLAADGHFTDNALRFRISNNP